MKNITIKNSFLWLTFTLFIFSCNSGSKKGSDVAGFFAGTSGVDVERLQYDLTEDLVDSVGVKEFLKGSDFPSELNKYFISFYEERDYLPAWIDEDGINHNANELLEAIKKSKEHGFNEEDYKLAYLQHLKKKLDEPDVELKEFQKFDKELTAAYLKLANHLLRGRINPKKFDELWYTNLRKKDLAEHLQQALEDEEVAKSLQTLEPKYKGYAGLKKALERYEEIATAVQSWSALPNTLKLQPGDSGKYVAEIAHKLYVLGDLKKQMQEDVFDRELAKAVLSFQKRHGLEQDTIVAGKTLGMLNVTPQERLQQIKLNLERFRWLPEQPEGRYVFVNVPEYKLFVYEGADTVMSMRVIVGKAYESTTPIFNDEMEFVTFSPTWTVPLSIASEEMLPKLIDDPNYLTDRNYNLYANWQEDAEELNPRDINWKKVKPEEFKYRVVQNPGAGNALGRVKFMFPNNLDIYLHDTPSDHLFSRTERDFSHGCIRVEQPVELATYLLNDKGLNKKTVEDYMHRPEPVNVSLSKKVPVFIDYHTAWLGGDGKVNFREDIYGHDRKQLGALKESLAMANNK